MDIGEVLILVGAIVFVAGVAMIWAPAAVIISGIFLGLAGYGRIITSVD